MSRTLTDREIVQLIAALRYWQDDHKYECLWWEGHKQMTDEEIDELCERINHREHEEKEEE